MSRFAVAYFSLMNGELKLELIEAVCELDAALIMVHEDWKQENFKSLEELVFALSHNEDWLEVKEILT